MNIIALRGFRFGVDGFCIMLLTVVHFVNPSHSMQYNFSMLYKKRGLRVVGFKKKTSFEGRQGAGGRGATWIRNVEL